MKRITFLDVGLDCGTDTMTVDSSVSSLDPEDAMAVREGYTDAFVNACRGKSPEQVRAIQTMLLSFAAGIAAASGCADENVKFFTGLVREQKRRFTS